MYQSLLNEDYAYQHEQYHNSRRMSYGDQFSSSSTGSISSRENSPYSSTLEYYEPSFVYQYRQQQVNVHSFDNLCGNTGFDDAFHQPSKGKMVHNDPMTGVPITVKNHLYSPVTAHVTIPVAIPVTISRHPSLPALSPAAECTSVAPIVPSQLPICNSSELYQNSMMFSPLYQEQHQYRPLPITRHVSPCISEQEGSSLLSTEKFTTTGSSIPDYALQQLLQLLPNGESNKENQAPTMKLNNTTTTGGGKAFKNKSTRVKRDEINSGVTKTKRKSTSCNQQDNTKQFLCDEEGCGKVFRRSEHLKRHTRSIHTKEKRKFLIKYIIKTFVDSYLFINSLCMS
jgi:hypothetical protein